MRHLALITQRLRFEVEHGMIGELDSRSRSELNTDCWADTATHRPIKIVGIKTGFAWNQELVDVDSGEQVVRTSRTNVESVWIKHGLEHRESTMWRDLLTIAIKQVGRGVRQNLVLGFGSAQKVKSFDMYQREWRGAEKRYSPLCRPNGKSQVGRQLSGLK